jgi:hypothetical protein
MASLFGGGGSSNSGGLNQERLEMALTELAPFSPFRPLFLTVGQNGHGYRPLQPHGFVSRTLRLFAQGVLIPS